MATMADSLVSLINTDYGDLGGGGSKPTIGNRSDYKDEVSATDADYVLVWLPVPVRIEELNDTYVNRYHKMRVRIITDTSDTRMKEISDEIIRLVGAGTITGVQKLRCLDEEDMTDRRGPIYIYEITVMAAEEWADRGTGYSGSAVGSSFASMSFVTTEAESGLDSETVLSMSADNTLSATLTMMAIAFVADSSYDIGTNTVRPKKIYSDDLDSTAATIGTLTLSTPLSDANVANDITASNYVATADHTKAAHDALSLSHDSLADVSASDHHAKYTDAEARTAAVEDDAYGAGWDGDTTHAPSQNAVYDQLEAHYADVDAHQPVQVHPGPLIEYVDGADASQSGHAKNTLVRFAAAETNDQARFNFVLPTNAVGGSYALKGHFITPTAGDTADFKAYIGQAKDADADPGWNILNNAALWTVTTTAAGVIDEVSYTITSCEAGDHISVRLYKSTTSGGGAKDFHLISLWMEAV